MGAAPAHTGYFAALQDYKRHLVTVALKGAGGNRTHAAAALGLRRTFLQRLIRELGIEIPPARPRRPPAPTNGHRPPPTPPEVLAAKRQILDLFRRHPRRRFFYSDLVIDLRLDLPTVVAACDALVRAGAIDPVAPGAVRRR
jgi:hypothetical protein